MERKIKLIIFSIFFVLAMALTAEAVTVDVYSGHSTSGGGAPYSGFVGSFTSPDIMFATATNDWHPYGLGAFGADITGSLSIISGGTYIFTLYSDDGSILFIDGAMVVNNGGAHGPASAFNSVMLSAGLHSFEVQYYEDFGGESCLGLYLPQGVTYANSVPEPASLLLLGLGLLGLAGAGRKRK